MDYVLIISRLPRVACAPFIDSLSPALPSNVSMESVRERNEIRKQLGKGRRQAVDCYKTLPVDLRESRMGFFSVEEGTTDSGLNRR